MKHQLIHRIGKFHWNIIVESGYGYISQRELVHITVKSNCPEYYFYPARAFTCEVDQDVAAAFLVWVREQPIHQFANVVKYLLLGHRETGFGWEAHYEMGKRYYEMACRGEKIEAEDKAAYALFIQEARAKEAYQEALRGKGQVGVHP